ncbi:prim-pol domain-containing protein [Sanghuangporus baumii]|uniref:DNA primase n=1 Tax=Sanghuangporus baumii TaxID=108892 RepID=A0A9Q5NAD4_SANBA|nr:prim-pol domain-containing protein [Sanghuangporus baumii]
MQVEDDASAPEVMMAFYKRLYPFKSVFSWLNHQHAPTRLFTHREFAFTLQGDVYIRYNSFANAEELKKQVVRLNPSRFEIGAVYNARPRDKKTLRPGALQPLQRELVFDIDMTDYDEIRTCCSGKGICKRCWGFIAVAVKILDHTLREHLGFRHILWVYSGRRGIHCWISDQEALQLTDEQRKSIMGWLEVIKGGQDMAKKVNVRGQPNRQLHPSLQSALQIARGDFPRLVLQDQNCFSTAEQTSILLELLGNKEVEARLRKRWAESSKTSEEKWEDIKREISQAKSSGKDTNNSLYRASEDIVLQYTYPRLDAEVSKHRNHLLKAPFCVHPATGRVCVPVDPLHVDRFDPETVPSVGQLLRELDDLETNAGTDGIQQSHHSGQKTSSALPKVQTDSEVDWERTSLKPYVEMLDAHISSPSLTGSSEIEMLRPIYGRPEPIQTN